jgi:3-methyl-2-oxobutanoate hydroxymethyltransferase
MSSIVERLLYLWNDFVTTSFDERRVSVEAIRAFKGREALVALTCYDYPTARLLDEVGVPLLLVGDSLGMVVLGYADTTGVTLGEMVHHTRAVARARPRAVVVADMPAGTYREGESAVAAARALLDAGADAVKLEGGRACSCAIEALAEAGIAFMGHIGMLPQRIHEEGGRYRVKGRSDEERAGLVADALYLERCGAFALVLELVVPEVAGEIRRAVRVPTVGIGSGDDCDGQILVFHDVVGYSPWFRPRFAQAYGEVGVAIQEAARRFMRDVERRYGGVTGGASKRLC